MEKFQPKLEIITLKGIHLQSNQMNVDNPNVEIISWQFVFFRANTKTPA